MEVGAHVWLRDEESHWGWVPAVITNKEEILINNTEMFNLTLKDDPEIEITLGGNNSSGKRPSIQRQTSAYYENSQNKFEVIITVDPEQLKTADHDDIKLRNLPNSYQLSGEDPIAGVIASPSTKIHDEIIGGVDDLIGLTHLHEPAILHALRLRYDEDIIYTSTGPILIAVNPFKSMDNLYNTNIKDMYRLQGEQGIGKGTTPIKTTGKTPLKSMKLVDKKNSSSQRLPPHVYQTADDAYRAMIRGMENNILMGGSNNNNGMTTPRNSTRGGNNLRRGESSITIQQYNTPTDQSILVSGESGAGKTVTTKIVLNYFAMLSRKLSMNDNNSNMTTPMKSLASPTSGNNKSPRNTLNSSILSDTTDDVNSTDVSIEQQVLQSNPVLESFGNARTIRNDNSSRFGKYIDIRFTSAGKLYGAHIETYLLEKVRLIHPSYGERNYHVFYQFLSSATNKEKEQFYIENLTFDDFKLLNQSNTYDRRDGILDTDNHYEILDAMITIGFEPTIIQSLMQLVMCVLFAGNITFTESNDGEECYLNENDAAYKTAALLGVTFEDLSTSLTTRVILAANEIVHKPLNKQEATKANEALIKAVYGAAFDYIVENVNKSIERNNSTAPSPRNNNNNRQNNNIKTASIGVLDIFGFETFDINNYEQLCINYTNEALQQQFNKYVFKLEQQEYEKEGILWKFISFPDNQDVIDLIDKKHTGIIALLDEQCIIPKSTDEKFTRYLYGRCDDHPRFHASSSQRVDYKFSIEHYAGLVEYTTTNWIEKNKDQLPASCQELLESSEFHLIHLIKKFVRIEDRAGRGTIASKSVGSQFSEQLRLLRTRIDTTVPHYIRCLKPNDNLVSDYFEPKNIVEQLRCGGVLEAVRVSRAGYPTRYPHDVFLARYYILGDNNANNNNNEPMSPVFASPGSYNNGSNSYQQNNHEQKLQELKKLIMKIAYDLWEADHEHMMAVLEYEEIHRTMGTPSPAHGSAMMKSPKFFHKTKKGQMTGPRGPAFSLTVESSVKTPEAKHMNKKGFGGQGVGNNKNKKKNKLSSSAAAVDHGHNIARPESKEDFLALDFSSRCAVAGLQLGRTKVFLRREAFDRIEALRSDKFFTAASAIQKIVRGKLIRVWYLTMKGAAVMIQSIMRMKVATNYVDNVRYEHQLEIERLQRELTQRQLVSACKIQSIVRMYQATALAKQIADDKKRTEEEIAERQRIKEEQERQRAIEAEKQRQRAIEEEEQRKKEEQVLRSVTALQAMYRGGKVRFDLLEEMNNEEPDSPVKTIVPSPEPTYRPPKPSPRGEDDNNDRQITPIPAHSSALVPIDADLQARLSNYIQEENWSMVESTLDKHPELAEAADPQSGELPLHMISRHNNAWTLLIDMVLVLYPKALIHHDNMGALPIHHAAAHDNLAAIEIIYSAYKEGVNDTDKKGRLPIHVAAEFDAVETVKFLLAKSPEGAFTMVYRPPNNSGGGLPLHIACRNYASIGVITALLSENFASAKRTDENGDLPLHLLLRCGEVVDQVVVKTLLTCFSSAVSRTDMNGDLPLHIALKNQCRSAVINTVLMQFPEGASVLNGDGHSPLFLAFKHNADDRTIMGLLNHAPDSATAVDRKTGMLPIQMATENEHSHFIVHNLLKRDMPIDLQEKIRAQLIPHHYSWNHILSNTEDLYHQVVTKILQTCTQPQVLALAHVEGPDGNIALAAATPVCKHELRVMLRLFNTLEVVNQRPAYTNPISDTQIFYALRYEPPEQQSGTFTVLHDDKRDGGDNDYVEDWDDASQTSGMSRRSNTSALSTRSQQTIDDKLRRIRKEKGQQVIAKLTSRSDIVERELKVRKEFHLSRHYVPAIISVHHTVQHAAYSEAMAEPGYCITMEGADTTAENLMLDTRKAGKKFPEKALKRIGISLLHMHEHGLVHGDFGTHNIGKFGSRWKLLGVGGSVKIGDPTDPNRGFYHPPESVVVENMKRSSIGNKKSASACVVSISASAAYDIWAYGVVVYEAIAGAPLSAYACRGKRAMSQNEIAKIGLWDERSMRKALNQLPPEVDDASRDLIKQLLHHDPQYRSQSLRDVLEHPFFTGGREKFESKNNGTADNRYGSSVSNSRQHVESKVQDAVDRSQPVQNLENHVNGVPMRVSQPVGGGGDIVSSSNNNNNYIHQPTSKNEKKSWQKRGFGNIKKKLTGK